MPDHELTPPSFGESSTPTETHTTPTPTIDDPSQYAASSATKLASITIRQSDGTDLGDSNEPEDDTQSLLTSDFARLSMQPSEGRFFGRSSGMVLVQAVYNLKREVTGALGPAGIDCAGKRPEYWEHHSVSWI